MPGRFEIQESNGIYTFELITPGSEKILHSEEYYTAASCVEAILTLQENAAFDPQYERRTTQNEQYYFVISREDGRTIATSALYWTPDSRDYAILTVKRECACAVIVEQ
jgi:uncharacterized protein YegP (UPF0339 family)